VVNERVDLVNVVLNVVVMERFMWNLNVIHVDLKIEQPGRIIQEVVRVMVMVVKHLMKSVMIVMDEVINKQRKGHMNISYFIINLKKKKKLFFFDNKLMCGRFRFFFSSYWW
jgi:hypothetical protein